MSFGAILSTINKQNVEVAIGLAHVYLRRAERLIDRLPYMERTVTLEMLIEWHQRRAGDCFAALSRATIMPKAETQALKATAQFHIAAVRLLCATGAKTAATTTGVSAG